MKKLIIINSQQSITRNDIVEFEKEYHLKLPENYIAFLLKYNGGGVYDEGSEGSEYVQSFNSLKYGKLTLEFMFDNYCISEDLIDKEYLPIACGYGGNPITLCLKAGKDYGKIIIFYMDMDEDPQTIADSLEELLGVKSIDEL
ncbi:SMI1/KNR4 family protein [Flavobacterium sp. JP2137]|uniref:SMI1/KNR4 family protein n=1 Tax=Flavobacterium sp. JP2137 TaxID=3414510 RepID=UPI003D2FBD01